VSPEEKRLLALESNRGVRLDLQKIVEMGTIGLARLECFVGD